MHLHAIRLKNFRRLKDVAINLESDISILVGANNSGKTSSTHAIDLFTRGAKDEFSLHDFSADCWQIFDSIGNGTAREEETNLPKISLDLWFSVNHNDLHRVIDLLPSLDWNGSLVGIRIEFGPTDGAQVLSRFSEAKTKAVANIQTDSKGKRYHPWPKNLTDYLSERLRQEYELRYYVLDQEKFDSEFRQVPTYSPRQINPEKGRGGHHILNKILRVDFLNAQRHLSEKSGGRAEDLSKCLSRFYSRNLEQRADDYTALKALTDSEAEMNEHLASVFAPTLEQLSELNYPGLTNPRLQIKSALNPTTIMSSRDGARVHYILGEQGDDRTVFSLPDAYNGLGFKNLIYMAVELLDFHARWLATKEDCPPLHLVFIEEPEAHLHTQLQQVFIRKILDILKIAEDQANHYTSQLVITTHSPHILYERGFKPIRYFRRGLTPATELTSEVLNLSKFYANTENPTRDFLERYMKLTHCDLFFADAAILVEGNVERLLMPLMIGEAAPSLRKSCLSILEIGGAFGYRFRTLIEFLGIKALIITDIDSVFSTGNGNNQGEDGAETGAHARDYNAETDEEALVNDEEEENAVGLSYSRRKACPVSQVGAITSNQTLIQWLPQKTRIDELLTATPEERTQEPTTSSLSRIRVTYQTLNHVTWNGETKPLAGRTLEEAFALENLAWCQHQERQSLGLRIRNNEALSLDSLVDKVHRRVKSSSFNKTDFALGLLAEDPTHWKVPTYIEDGLRWLAVEVDRPPTAPALSGHTPCPDAPTSTPADPGLENDTMGLRDASAPTPSLQELEPAIPMATEVVE